MKAILISIKPKWVAKILNGEKTIEIRKTMPKCDLPIDVYIYCTKDKNDLVKFSMGGVGYKTPNFKQDYSKNVKWIGNGKVVAKFTLNKVEEIYFENHKSIYCDDPLYPETDSLSYDELLDKSCTKALPYGETEIGNYIGEKGYAWHISNLVIFEKPIDLWKFEKKVHYTKCETCPFNVGSKMPYCATCEFLIPLKQAPQSYCFIEVK